MTSEEMKQRALKAATDLILASWQKAGGYPPQRPLSEELAIEHRRAIELAKEREAQRLAARDASTWMCVHCQTIHAPTMQELPNGRWIAVPIEACECDAAQYERQAATQAEAERQRALHLAYLETLELWQQFDVTWPAEQEARTRLARAKEKVRDWYANKRTASLILTGDCGSGKSHLLRCMVKAYGLQGFVMAFYNESQILDALTRKDDWAYEMLDKCKKAKLLALDDIGACEFNASSEWMKNLLRRFYYQILERRNDGGLITLFSSNYKLLDLEPVVGQRAYDRMFKLIGGIENIIDLWDVPSYRRKDF